MNYKFCKCGGRGMVVDIFIGIGVVLGGIYFLGVVVFLAGVLFASTLGTAFGGKGFNKRTWIKAIGHSLTWPLRRLPGNSRE